MRAASELPNGIERLIGRAIGRIRSVDEFVQFDTYPGSPGIASVSAIEEMREVLSTLRPKARTDFGRIDAPASEHHSCCGHDDGIAPDPNPIVGSIVGLRDVELQNQDGEGATFGDIFLGRPSLITFFYTRCMNPDKCSRTISQLGEIQRVIRDRGVGSSAMIAGITYDPQYDLPQRLRRYGEDRGLVFGESCQLLRTTGPFEVVRDSLQLGVGYGSATVNRHRIELLLTDAAGAIVYSNVRRLWDAREVTDLLLAIQG
ncbi:SCO family protein [Bradyrhizobium sp. USDA 10063]